jgi:hypothetical protein
MPPDELAVTSPPAGPSSVAGLGELDYSTALAAAACS